MSLQIDSDNDNSVIWKLTAEQRQIIYEQEKKRIAANPPPISKRTKIIVGSYLAGCLILYSGLFPSISRLISTGKWKIQPESHLFNELFGAIVELIRPFIAAYMVYAIALLLFFSVYSVVESVKSVVVSVKNFIHRKKHDDD